MIDNHIFHAPSLKEAIAMAHQSLGSSATIIDMHCIPSDEPGVQIYEVHARGVIQKSQEEAGEGGVDIITQPSSQSGAREKLQQALLDVTTLRDSTSQWRDSSDHHAELESHIAPNPMAGKPIGMSPQTRRENSPSAHIQLIHDSDQQNPLAQGVSNAVRYLPPVWLRQGPIRAAIVGPSGVGKTAALFKIAGIANMRHDLTVSIVNLDVHRPGRIEEHARLSELLGIPHHNLRQAKELPNLLDVVSHVDLVLIDTPGENPWELTQSSPLLDSLNAAHVELHLVTPATWSSQNLQRLINVYQNHGAMSAIATRVAESRSVEHLVHSLTYSQLALSAISVGDDITGMIHAANATHVEALLNDMQPGNGQSPATFAR